MASGNGGCTVPRRGWSGRLTVALVTLVLTVGGVTAAQAGAHAAGSARAEFSLGECGNGGTQLIQGSTCWAAQTIVTLTSADPVAALDGAAAVVDSRPVDKNTLDYLTTVIHCYNVAETPVYGLGAIRNIWPGVNPGGDYPKGVLKAAPGKYTCRLEVKEAYTGNANNLNYTLSTHRLTATLSKAGATSSGPGYGTQWLGIPPNHHATYLLGQGGQVEGARTQLGVPSGESVIQVNSMVNLTSCSATSDVTNADCPPKRAGSTLVTIDLLIWQTRSDGSTQCRPPTDYVIFATLDQYIHHDTPSLLEDYTMVSGSGCTRTVVAKNIVSLPGSIDVYLSNQNTAVGIYA